MQAFLFILTNNIIPIFILISLGYLLNKKFNLDILTLSKLNFYIFVPMFIFSNLYTTDIPVEMLKVFLFAILMLVLNMLVGDLIARIRKYDTAMKSAFSNSIMFYNSGNVGLPLITLVFSSMPYVIDGNTPYLELAVTTQITVLVVQNITTNTLGFFNAGKVNLHWKDSIGRIIRMPVIYAIPSALIFKTLPFDLTQTPIWPALQYARNAMVPIALLALGVQLSKTAFEFKDKDSYIAVAIRLLGGPLLAFVLIQLMQFDGIIAQALLISSSVPTAVNAALIAVEYNNRPEFSSQVVATSTLMSAVTLTAVIYVARILFPVM